MRISSKKRSRNARDILRTKPDFIIITYSQLLHEWKALDQYHTIITTFLLTQIMHKTIEMAEKAYRHKVNEKTLTLPNTSILADI